MLQWHHDQCYQLSRLPQIPWASASPAVQHALLLPSLVPVSTAKAARCTAAKFGQHSAILTGLSLHCCTTGHCFTMCYQ